MLNEHEFVLAAVRSQGFEHLDRLLTSLPEKRTST
jgi:hypothetical protein